MLAFDMSLTLRKFMLRQVIRLKRVNKSFYIVKKFSTQSARAILGIETSCDDTGCAIINGEGKILGECLVSQQDTHTRLGGIIPPIARDLHKENIGKVVNETLKSADMDIGEVDAIAVTVKPGLPLSLAVGLSCAKSLCVAAHKPIIPIHHMEAHALTVRMIEKVEFPFLVLLVSGGHSLIAVAEGVDKFLLLGKSFDDAPGEALDKIGRRLKIWNMEGYDGLSGGRAIEILSEQGNPTAFPIAEPLLHNSDCNFSFAGIKNSARLFILEEEKKYGIEGGDVLPNVSDLCASVQLAVTKHLCRRIQRAIVFSLQQSLISTDKLALVVSGGVAANNFIRKGITELCNEMECKVFFPPSRLCTDNGIMIAWNGVEKWRTGIDLIPPNEVHLVDFQGKAPFGEDISQKVRGSGIKCQWAKSVFSKKAFYA